MVGCIFPAVEIRLIPSRFEGWHIENEENMILEGKLMFDGSRTSQNFGFGGILRILVLRYICCLHSDGRKSLPPPKAKTESMHFSS